VPVVSTDLKKYLFSCNYLNASKPNVHSMCWWDIFEMFVTRIQIQSNLQWWTRVEQIKALCELHIWWVGNCRYKALLFACAGEGHFIPSEWMITSRKAVCCRVYCWHCNAVHLPKKHLVFKICGRNITLTQWVHTVSIQILQTPNSYSFHMKVCIGMSECIRVYI